MPKCCAYGIPNDPQGNVVRWTLCWDDEKPCPQLAAFRNMGSWPVSDCASCLPPQDKPQPKLRCCTYAIANDPAGRVVRWQICLPAKARCPRIDGLRSVGSRLVTSCKDCCGVATKNFPIKPALLKKLKASAPAAKKARRATKRR